MIKIKRTCCLFLIGFLAVGLVQNAMAQAPVVNKPKWDAQDILANAINNLYGYSKGYPEQGYYNVDAKNDGFIAGIILSTAVVPKVRLSTETLNVINAYDKAEVADTYFGETNMIAASSFNGIRGVYAGYDFARPDDIQNQVGTTIDGYSGAEIPLYRLKAMQDGTRNILGSNDDRRFRYAPGAFVIAALKSGCYSYKEAKAAASDFPIGRNKGAALGGIYVYAAVAMGIAAGRDNAATDTGSSIYVEDFGAVADHGRGVIAVGKKMNRLMLQMADTINKCGADQKTPYNAIYIGWKATLIQPRQYGCGVVAGPYLTLPYNAPSATFEYTDYLSQQDWLDKTSTPTPVLQPYQADTYNGPVFMGSESSPDGFWASGESIIADRKFKLRFPWVR
jgi:hypothetical protein